MIPWGGETWVPPQALFYAATGLMGFLRERLAGGAPRMHAACAAGPPAAQALMPGAHASH